MSATVGHHFRCPACDYDLFTAPLDGKCPECGRAIPRRKGLDKPKNPRRVNSQHHARLRRARRSFVLFLPLTLVPLAVAVGSFWFHVPGWLRVLSWVFTFTGALALVEARMDIAHHAERVVPEDDRTA
jgi:hypothetical protein